MKQRMNAYAVRSILLFLPLLMVVPFIGAQSAPGMEQAPQIDPVSDQELQAFAVAYVEVQVLQGRLDERIDATLDESELEADRFYEINQMAQQTDGSEGLPGVDDDELEEFRVVLDDLLAIQNEMRQQMVETVRDEDLTVERFNEIIVAIQQDPSLGERAQSYIQQRIEEHDAS